METSQMMIPTNESEYQTQLKFAQGLISTGFLPQSIRTPQQALAIILTGHEIGIGPMEALRQIDVIQNRPCMKAQLMLALAYRRVPGFSITVVTRTDELCEIIFRRKPQPDYTHSFSFKEAVAMQLAGKDNWKKQPAVMLYNRCVSAGLRIVAPDAIAGIYTPEEINPDLKVDPETGEIEETKAPVITIPQPKLMNQTVIAAEIFKPEKVEYAEGETKKDITQEVQNEIKKKAGRPKKTPTLRVGKEQIDVLDSYSIKDKLKSMGYRWNQELNAWSIPFSEDALDEICAELNLKASDYTTF